MAIDTNSPVRDEADGDVPTAQPGPTRRDMFKRAGIGAAALGAVSFGLPHSARAGARIDDNDILNFALNLEYLEAEFYLMAVRGHGLPHHDSTGVDGPPGHVDGGAKVVFSSKAIQDYAEEIAHDELNHVLFLRAALGSNAVARPAINLNQSFTTLARAAGIVGPNGSFNPFIDDNSFLLGAFIFEDVGVTAYNGAGASISNPDYLTAATSILAVEAYHAASVRLQLLQQGLSKKANLISKLRAELSAQIVADAGDDQGITLHGRPNIVPTDTNSLAFARSPAQVLNIVYGGGASSDYLFYPNKMNGTIS